MPKSCANAGSDRGHEAEKIAAQEAPLQAEAIRWVKERNLTHTEMPGVFNEIAQLVSSGAISEALADQIRIRIDLKARELEKKGLGLSWTEPGRVFAAGAYRDVAAAGMVREHAITQASTARAVGSVLENAFESLGLDLDGRTEKGTPLKELLKQNVGKDFPVVRMYAEMHDAASTSSTGPIHDVWGSVLSKGGGEAVVRDSLSVLWETTGGFGGRLLTFVDSVAEFEVTLYNLEGRLTKTVTGFVARHGSSETSAADIRAAVAEPIASLNLNPMKWGDSARAGCLERLETYATLLTLYRRREEEQSGLKSADFLEKIFIAKAKLLNQYIEWFESAPAIYVPELLH